MQFNISILNSTIQYSLQSIVSKKHQKAIGFLIISAGTEINEFA